MRLEQRVAALKILAGPWRTDRCSDCGEEHVDVALSLGRLQARYAGQDTPRGGTCACPCCRPMLDDLAARYVLAQEREVARERPR